MASLAVSWRPHRQQLLGRTLAHPTIATVVAGMTLWITWPNRGLVPLLVFVSLAFPAIIIIFYERDRAAGAFIVLDFCRNGLIQGQPSGAHLAVCFVIASTGTARGTATAQGQRFALIMVARTERAIMS
jgi:hypothetical protein